VHWSLGVLFPVKYCFKAKKFVGMSARRRRRTVEDEDIAQELFLDSDKEDIILSHDSDSDQDKTQ
jgi:acetyl-CoA carboxylase beta subunit